MSDDATLDEFVEMDGDRFDEFEKPELIQGVAWSTIESTPKGWTVNNVESDIEILSGNNFSSEYFVEEGGISLIRIRDLAEDETTINFEGDYDSKYLINQQDLLVGMDGEFEPHLWKGPQALLNQRVCKIEPNNKYNKIFFRYAIEKPLFYIQKSIAGTTVKHLSQSNINDLNLLTPPLSEQRKIATVLYTVDRAIEKTEQIIDQVSRVQKAVTHNLLSGNGSNEPDTSYRIGPKEVELPKNWEVKRVSEISDIKNGNRIVKGHDYSDSVTKYPFIRIVDMEDGTVSTDEIKYLKQETAEKMTRGIIYSDDVYITVTGRVGDAGTIPNELDGARFTDNAAKLYNLEGILPKYLSLYLRSKFGQDEVHRFTVGSSQPKLSMYRVEKMEVIVPPIKEQEKIIKQINNIKRNKNWNERIVQNLKTIKHGLMQDLLSGTVRTTDTNIEVPEEIAKYG